MAHQTIHQHRMSNSAAWKFDLLNRMCADSRLTPTAFRVAYRLLFYADNATRDCFPKQERIAADLGITDRGVRSALANLRVNGWLWIEKRPSPTGRGTWNFYHFGDHSEAVTTGTSIPVKAATTGTLEQDFRKPRSGPSLKEEPIVNRNLSKRERRVARPAADRGHRIPDDYKPDPSIAIAEGMTPQQAARTVANFVDYWKAQAGPKARKLDWNATWRVWCRRERGPNGRAPPRRDALSELLNVEEANVDEQKSDLDLFRDGDGEYRVAGKSG